MSIRVSSMHKDVEPNVFFFPKKWKWENIGCKDLQDIQTLQQHIRENGHVQCKFFY